MGLGNINPTIYIIVFLEAALDTYVYFHLVTRGNSHMNGFEGTRKVSVLTKQGAHFFQILRLQCAVFFKVQKKKKKKKKTKNKKKRIREGHRAFLAF